MLGRPSINNFAIGVDFVIKNFYLTSFPDVILFNNFSWQRYSLLFHRDAKRQRRRYHAKRGNEK